MSKGFIALQKDIQEFLVRFDKYVEDKGEELEELAKELQATIDALQSKISEYVTSSSFGRLTDTDANSAW